MSLSTRFIPLAAASALSASLAFAQDFPNKPIRVVLPTAPGVSLDVTTRLVMAKVSERTGWTMVAENRTGGDFIPGTLMAVQAPADGYTLLIAVGGIAILPFSKKELPFDVVRDLTPVARIGSITSAFLLHPSVPATTLPEFIAYAKANPGKLSYGVTGTGSSGHLAVEVLKAETGIDMVLVPYKDSITPDLLAGRIHFGSTSLLTTVEAVKSGKLRALVVTSGSRSPLLPEIPTAVEVFKNPEMEMDSWSGFLVRSGTPQPIIDRLSREILAVMNLQETKDAFIKIGYIPLAENQETFRRKIASDMVRWQRVIKQIGLQPS